MRIPVGVFTAFLTFSLAACEPPEPPPSDAPVEGDQALSWQTLQDSTHRIVAVEGFAGPEAVRYDPDQDVYFVSNFNGDVAGDANGFISRVGPDGTLDSLRFMMGTEAAPLHAPRGLFIVGDTLWAADAEGVHGFHRESGEHLDFVDFTSFEPGFLNDIAQGPDGALYVTDTSVPRIYRMASSNVTIAIEDTLLGPPNGITWDAEEERFLLAPWGGVQTFRAWRTGETDLEEWATSAGGNFDGIEVVDGRVLVASQADSSLHVLDGGQGQQFITLPGRPADIGVDTQRMRVAIPYVALNRVDIWPLPREE